jgi:ATP-dependent protease ClpP protease subunit
MKKRGTDLILGGELVLSGYVMSDEAAGWAWEEEIYFCPQMVREALLAMGDGEVVVRLNSNGGDPVAGEAIRATLANHPGGCRIIVEGNASSAASLILMGGSRREMTAGSFIMLHNPSGYVYANADGMRAQADFLDMLARVYAQVYADRSGQTVEDVLAIMAAETFYTVEDAIEAGFVDAVASEGDAAKPAPVIGEEMRLQMRSAMNTYAALMRDKAPTGASGAGHNPAAPGGALAPVAATMEQRMPDPITPTPPVQPPAPTDPQAPIMAERNRISMIRSMATPFMAAGRLPSGS